VSSHACRCEVERELYVPRMAGIVDIRDETEKEKLFRLEMADGKPLGHEPGQFVQVCCFGIGEAPISMASLDDGTPGFELCVRNVGNVTAHLHAATIGEIVGIRGPYGRGFDVDGFAGHSLLIVAGGIGLVPLRALIQAALARREDFLDLTILYGFKSPGEMLFRDELEALSARADVDLRLTVDRPHPDWDGHVGEDGRRHRRAAHHVPVRHHRMPSQGAPRRAHHPLAGAPHEVRGGQVRALPDQ